MIFTEKIPSRKYILALLTLLFIFVGRAHCAPKAPVAIKEVVVTNYVGTDDTKQATPEYMARTVLRADGTALYFGNPTYAPRKGQFKGTFAPSYFVRINKMLRSVFDSKQSAKMPTKIPPFARMEFKILGDNGARRHLISYESEENHTLLAALNIAYGLTWKIKWQPYTGIDQYNRDLSGVRGFVLRGSRSEVRSLGAPSAYIIPGTTLSLRTSAGKEIAHGQSDIAGRFCLAAPPGTYDLVPILPNGITPDPASAKQTVTVTPNGFSDVFIETVAKGA